MGDRTDRPGLDRDTIVAAALDLVDEVGLDQLSLRRLATTLGVKSPALYWHFRDKAELLDRMAQAVLHPVRSDSPDGYPTWRDWVAAHARRRRRVLLAHRDGGRMVVGTRPGPDDALRGEQDLRVLVGQGFTPVEAFRILICVAHFVTGFVVEEQAGRQRPAPAPASRPTGPAAAPPPTPLLHRAITEGGPPENDDAFEFGLYAMLRGFEPDAGRPPGATPSPDQ